jgi:arginine-tRNA-protein transferase
MTAPSPCPYLEGKHERKVFTELKDDKLSYDRKTILEHFNSGTPTDYSIRLNHSLTLVGFRRSQDIAYRPACENCQECKSVRVPVVLFNRTKSQNRIFNKNKDLTIEIKANIATDEQFELLKKYIDDRHDDGGMSSITIEEYKDMVESSLINTNIIEYRQQDGTLIAATLTDQMSDSLSMVYSFFDVSKSMNKRSLGVFMVLSHIELAITKELDHVYLGYWVKNSPKMNYKFNFKPLEVLISDGWNLIK